MIVGSFVFGFCVIAPVLAGAQVRVPHEESTALGFDVGVFSPRSDLLDGGGLMGVNYDYYVTPRVSLRSSFGWSTQEFDTGGPDSLRQMPLRLDVNYNWEGGQWHPFVGAGVGAYFMQFRNNGQTIGDMETKFGANLGGGVEYFFNRSVAFKGEGRYHAVQSARGVQPSGLAFTAGLKTYF
jgi:opacity protein-like surface antigen